MYALSQAFRAIRSNWIASVSTITTMTLSLTILAGFSLLSLNLNRTLGVLQSELQLAAYLERDANGATLLEEVAAWPEVEEVVLISPQEALQSVITDYPYAEQATALVDNPLTETLELRLTNPNATPAVSARLRERPEVEAVQDSSEAVETFLAINAALRTGGSVLIVILLSAAMFAIVNSIRAAITARRHEIEVMRLVGATRSFVRAPFLIEGFLLGLFSALVTLALVLPSYGLIVERLSERLLFIPFVREGEALGQVLGLLVALSLLVGLVGSAISVSQYLREQQ